MPVDPGEHRIEASRPGKQPWQTTVTVTAQPLTTAFIPALVDAAAPVPPPGEAAPVWGPQRIAGLAVGGAGVIGLAVGTVFGVKTLQSTSSANAYCSATQPYCHAQGLALEHDAATYAKVSDATIAVGGAAVVG